ncbi:MAG TPA: PQQ-dependent sugar dehydrogenase, partial [Gemmataceae bacterium]|nr:PQQ-dependent sugar dehydrogenase [Gemmataceae bacterium]
MSSFAAFVTRCTDWLGTDRARRTGLRTKGRLCRPRLSSPLRLEALEDRLVPISPAVLDPNLGLRTVVSGLTTPTTMAFVGSNDFFVVEKNTGKVDHVINGVVAPTFFDFGAGPVANLPVNFNSERGLLGIALSPNFANDHNVYLYWTESSTGAVSNVVGNVPVLGNRVDRFIWNAVSSTLTFDKNIIRLRSFQNDGNGGNPNQMAGNHNGGVIHFGPDGKLYIVIGDNGRRGWMQNLVNGPNGQGQTDENNGLVRGGPAPDNAHLTGVMLRLNPDGSVPSDNPFVDISASFQAALTDGPDTTAKGLGSFFTAFLNQARDTLSLDIAWEALGGPTLAGGGAITIGGRDGPAIFSIP